MPPVKISGHAILKNVSIGLNNSTPPVIPPVAPTVNSSNTTDTTPTITGTAVMHAGDVLSVEVDGELFNNVPVTSGNWSVTVTVPLAAGSQYGITATVTNTAAATATGTGTVTIEVVVGNLSVYDITAADFFDNYYISGTTRPINPATEYLNVILYESANHNSSWAWASDPNIYGTGDQISFYGDYWQVDTKPSGEPNFAGPYDIVATIQLLADNSILETATGTLTIDSNFVVPNTPDVAVNNLTTSNVYPTVTGTATNLSEGDTLWLEISTTPTSYYYNIVPDVNGDWSVDTNSYPSTEQYPLTEPSTTMSIFAKNMYGNEPDAMGVIDYAESVVAPTVPPTVDSATVSPGYPFVTGTATMNAGTDVLTFTLNGSVYGQAYVGDPNVSFNGVNWSSDTSDYGAISGPNEELVNGDVYPVVATITNAAGSITGPSADLTCFGFDLTVNYLSTGDTLPVITGTTPGGSSLVLGLYNDQDTLVGQWDIPNSSYPGTWSLYTEFDYQTGNGTPPDDLLAPLPLGAYTTSVYKWDDPVNNVTGTLNIGQLIVDNISANSATAPVVTGSYSGATDYARYLYIYDSQGATMYYNVQNGISPGPFSVDTGVTQPDRDNITTPPLAPLPSGIYDVLAYTGDSIDTDHGTLTVYETTSLTSSTGLSVTNRFSKTGDQGVGLIGESPSLSGTCRPLTAGEYLSVYVQSIDMPEDYQVTIPVPVSGSTWTIPEGSIPATKFPGNNSANATIFDGSDAVVEEVLGCIIATRAVTIAENGIATGNEGYYVTTAAAPYTYHTPGGIFYPVLSGSEYLKVELFVNGILSHTWLSTNVGSNTVNLDGFRWNVNLNEFAGSLLVGPPGSNVLVATRLNGSTEVETRQGNIIIDAAFIPFDWAPYPSSLTAPGNFQTELESPVIAGIAQSMNGDGYIPDISEAVYTWGNQVIVTIGGATYQAIVDRDGNYSVNPGYDTPLTGAFTPLTSGDNNYTVALYDTMYGNGVPAISLSGVITLPSP